MNMEAANANSFQSSGAKLEQGGSSSSAGSSGGMEQNGSSAPSVQFGHGSTSGSAISNNRQIEKTGRNSSSSGACGKGVVSGFVLPYFLGCFLASFLSWPVRIFYR